MSNEASTSPRMNDLPEAPAGRAGKPAVLLGADGPSAPVPAGAGAPEEEDALEAIAALSSNEGAREVGDPDPATLSSAMPRLEDIPDDAPAATPADGDGGGDGPQPEHGPGDTSEIDHIELTALLAEEAAPSQTMPFAPVKPTAPTSPIAVERISGTAKGTGSLAWGSRTDVGCVRTHNEDSFVIRFPLFAVADGMGGHAAGEVASTIAVSTLAGSAPDVPDSAALAAAIEEANRTVIEGAQSGLGRPGMGTTCTSVIIDGQRMAVGHVGDSRCYLLHAGQLVRVTHDHSYVEELVAAGEITPEEARIHPNRSIITRALGNDPAMKADHFTMDVVRGDRVMLCSDGLSSMIADDVIEEAMVSSISPQACADTLVDLALAAGGHDNVTCIVVDVKDDGVASRAFKMRLRNVTVAVLVVLAVVLAAWLGLRAVAHQCWYLGDYNGYVALYRGFPNASALLGTTLEEVTDIETAQLSDAIEQRLETGISCDSEEEARTLIEEYRDQVASSTGSSSTGSSSTGSSSTGSSSTGSSSSSSTGSSSTAADTARTTGADGTGTDTGEGA